MTEPESSQPSANRARTILFVVGGLFLLMIGVAAYVLLVANLNPPLVEIAKDAVLVKGRTIYLSRCVSCHGERGRGDGPISKSLTPPKPRDFVEDEWKYGETAEKSLAIVTNGVPGTSMAAWKASYTEPELRAVTAYVYYLAGKPVPSELRKD